MNTKRVNEFNAGDGISLEGFDGIVLEKRTENSDAGECTYLKVHFTNPLTVKYPYEKGWYGGLNDEVHFCFRDRISEHEKKYYSKWLKLHDWWMKEVVQKKRKEAV